MMRKRCYKSYSTGYELYGGRGIRVCDEWLNSFIAFHTWALNSGYRDELTLDRRENDGPYSPANCRWVDNTTQANNRRIPKNNTSGYAGVYFHKGNRKWKARICMNGKWVELGGFDDIKDAIRIRKEAEKLKKAGKEVTRQNASRKCKEPLPIPRERLQEVSANVVSVSA